MADPQIQTKLPENAYRELKPGETYVPMIPPEVTVPEVTGRSIIFGIAMNILFAMAATYLALKVGQGIETAIPISILAVGLSGFLLKMGLRRSNIIENINILAIGTTSGIVAGGTVFTMPAIYVLKLNEQLDISGFSLFFLIFIVPFLGAVLGAIFLVPFRRYFVKDMHGKLPFPEGTATNEILVTGGGEGQGGAWVLIYAFIVGFIYNALSVTFKLFGDVFTTGYTLLEVGKKTFETLAIAPLQHMTEKVKAVFFLGTGAELLGLGFIIGLRYASIICAGSFLSWFVIIPLLAPLSLEQLQLLNPEITGSTASDIFRAIPRNIGIGGIFTAGLLSIFKMSKVIVTALRQALGGLAKSKGGSGAHDRTDEDISYPKLLIIGLLTTIAILLYFRFVALVDMPNPTVLAILSVLLALAIAFLFTTVSAWAIAMISVTPISGMTVTTIIITAVLLLWAGLPTDTDTDRAMSMLAVLLVGGVVCTALSMAGTLVTEFKLGYWAGASPKRIQWSAIIAALLASALVTGTIMFLARTKGFDQVVDPSALAAPQANVMASALKSFIGGGQIPWVMYGVGVVMVLLVELVGVSGLAFALGMYLPMELNTPILVGAIVAWLVKRGTEEKLVRARANRGILIASGLIAGGAIAGVLDSILTAIDEEWIKAFELKEWLQIPHHLISAERSGESLARFGNWLAIFAFLALCVWSYWDSRRVKPSEVESGT